MILAAGRGERMRPLTDTQPKALLQAGQYTLIEWHLRSLARAGIDHVVINLSWQGEKIRSLLGDGSRHGVRIEYSEEGPQPLETGGGILRALPLLGLDPFIVVNADIWTDYPFERLAIVEGALAHLVLVTNPPHNRQGDFSLDNDRVAGEGVERWTFSGIGVYRPELFADCVRDRFPLAPVLQSAISAGSVSGELYSGLWWDIGTAERLSSLRSYLSR